MSKMNVVPGSSLGYRISDGFKAGNGTFVKDEMIYSSKLGSVYDLQKEITVGKDINLDKNKLYLGKVVKVNSTRAIIRISVTLSSKILLLDATLLAKDSGQDQLLDYFKLGDLLKTRLLSQLSDQIIYCTTAANDEGIILSKCSDCFSKLTTMSLNSMFCSNCKNIEKRKCCLQN